MYQFKVHISNEQHDAFVKTHPLCNLLQSSSWAKVKDNWKHEIVGVYEGDELIASASVLIKSLPMHFTMMYIPRGPIMDYENSRLVTYFMQELKKWAKQYHCLFITFDPAIHCNDYVIKEANENRYDNTKQIIATLTKTGCQFKGFTKDIDATIQPRYHANVYANEEFGKDMNKTLKKAFATLQKKKIYVEAKHEEGVEAFSKVMHCTEERKNIVLRDDSYFSKLLQIYKEDAIIFLAYLPLKELYEDTLQRYEENIKDLASCPDNAKKKRFTLEELNVSLTREVKEVEENWKKEGDLSVIAGALCVKFGETAEILYAGMDDRYKRYMAPNATFYACMEWSFQNGCQWSNMGGIEGDLQGGLTKFKSNFNPTINEFIGEFDLPVNTWLYKASQLAYTLRKKRK